MNSRTLQGAPVLWMALVLLALCIAGTLGMVGISAFKGADELPPVYNVEGQAADTDLRALTEAKNLGLQAQLSLQSGSVQVLLTDASGAAANREPLLLRLTHPTNAQHDRIVELRNEGDVAVGLMPDVPRTVYWNAELRPADSQWLLRGRLEPAGGRLGIPSL